ncbi:hypothetical protein CES85_0672 [Ochrobactrum quorumnocens]|uniref:Uncharacterized protein n=1 Tax=Ochrobactrum quorumnocens TaxID=271865 RepID=A0A248UEU4_9HYPH|nr:hypothetical protein CES85_0672 [[Ochrobactrum] quorumnocens]
MSVARSCSAQKLLDCLSSRTVRVLIVNHQSNDAFVPGEKRAHVLLVMLHRSAIEVSTKPT